MCAVCVCGSVRFGTLSGCVCAVYIVCVCTACACVCVCVRCVDGCRWGMSLAAAGDRGNSFPREKQKASGEGMAIIVCATRRQKRIFVKLFWFFFLVRRREKSPSEKKKA